MKRLLTRFTQKRATSTERYTLRLMIDFTAMPTDLSNKLKKGRMNGFAMVWRTAMRGRLIAMTALSMAIMLLAFGLPVTAYGSQNSNQNNLVGYVRYTSDLINNPLINGNLVNKYNPLGPWGMAQDPSYGYIYVTNSTTITFTIGYDTARIVGVSPGNSPGFINIISFIVFFLIISYIIIRRLRPRKFKASRLYKWTAIYVLLTLFLAVQISDPLLLLILPASGIIGYILGLKILERREIKFFYENDTLYYKWPTPIIVLWSGLFVIRLFLELLGSENIIVLSVVDILLSFSTGLIVSASIITVRQAKQFFK